MPVFPGFSREHWDTHLSAFMKEYIRLTSQRYLAREAFDHWWDETVPDEFKTDYVWVTAVVAFMSQKYGIDVSSIMPSGEKPHA